MGLGIIVGGVGAAPAAASIPLPPPSYQTPWTATVQVMDSTWAVHRRCHAGARVPVFGPQTIGCYLPLERTIIMPNPCHYKQQEYARLLCHEGAHFSGWPGDHPPEDLPAIVPRGGPYGWPCDPLHLRRPDVEAMAAWFAANPGADPLATGAAVRAECDGLRPADHRR